MKTTTTRCSALGQACADAFQTHRLQVRSNTPALDSTVRAIRLAALTSRALGLPFVRSRRAADAFRAGCRLDRMKGGKYFPIKRPRTHDGQELRFWWDWHAGRTGANLHGPMAHSFDPDWQGWDSLVQVAKFVVSGRGTTAVSRWRDALGLA